MYCHCQDKSFDNEQQPRYNIHDPQKIINEKEQNTTATKGIRTRSAK